MVGVEVGVVVVVGVGVAVEVAVEVGVGVEVVGKMRAYHFRGETLRDGLAVPPIGEWLEHTGEAKMCESGLHFSKHPFDALQYAPGHVLDLVEVEDIVEQHEDKGVCRRRKRIATVNAEPLLREFARWCALDVYHLWGNAKTDPDSICKRYLETGDESLRAAAWATAYDAASATARAAAYDAASAAASATARAAASAAARAAAWAAASATAWAAASATARAAAYDAAWAAASATARKSAWAARKSVAKKQRQRFTRMVNKAFKEESK